MFSIIASLIAIALVWVIMKTVRSFKHFQTMGVKVPHYWPILGHVYHMNFTEYRWKVVDKWYKEYKDDKMFGVYEFSKPCLMLTDVDLIKAVMVKDSDHFVDRRTFVAGKTTQPADVVMHEMLTNMSGERWKAMRSLLTPVFTSGKLKSMFPLILTDAENCVKFCEKQQEEHGQVRMEIALSRCMLSIIASCAFGLNLPITDQPSEFEKAMSEMTNINKWAIIKALIMMVLPSPICRLLKLQFAHRNTDFFINTAKQTLELRRKNNFRRDDFVDLIQDAYELNKNSENSKIEMSEETLLAQFVLFLFGGYETSTTSLSFTTFLLAKNQDVQEKLRTMLQKRIEEDGKLTYENISECSYLEAAIHESFRLYGLAFQLERKCTKAYTIPGTNVHVKPGDIVAVPSWSLAHDPDYWEDAEEFRPERFMPENKEKASPYMSMPFGIGPRSCIAMRFALLEAKVVIASLILNHKMTLPPDRTELRMNSNPISFRATEHGIPICYEKL